MMKPKSTSKTAAALLRKACAGEMTDDDHVAAYDTDVKAVLTPFKGPHFVILCSRLNQVPGTATRDGERPPMGDDAFVPSTGKNAGKRQPATGPRAIRDDGHHTARLHGLACAAALESGDLLAAMGEALAAAFLLGHVNPMALRGLESYVRAVQGAGSKAEEMPEGVIAEAKATGAKGGAVKVLRSHGKSKTAAYAFIAKHPDLMGLPSKPGARTDLKKG